METRIAPACLVVLTLATGGGCRVSGDFRIAARPDPVPRDPRTGAAHFYLEVYSLAHTPVHLGRPDGPVLRPGTRLEIPADLEPGQHVATIAIFDRAGARVSEARTRVASFMPDLRAERSVPIPRLGTFEARITSGFHSPNHRAPGHREALDVVPLVPDGSSAFGVEVRSPFAGRVIGVTRDQPDRPGSQPNELLVEDDEGHLWRLAHFQQASIPLRPGQRFEKGQLLGRIGLSGRTSGPHLHIERVARARRGKTR